MIGPRGRIDARARRRFTVGSLPPFTRCISLVQRPSPCSDSPPSSSSPHVYVCSCQRLLPLPVLKARTSKGSGARTPRSSRRVRTWRRQRGVPWTRYACIYSVTALELTHAQVNLVCVILLPASHERFDHSAGNSSSATGRASPPLVPRRRLSRRSTSCRACPTTPTRGWTFSRTSHIRLAWRTSCRLVPNSAFFSFLVISRLSYR